MSELVGVFPPSLDRDPLRRALDCLQEGFQIIGYDWHYIYLNPAAARHGRRPAERVDRALDFRGVPGHRADADVRQAARSMEDRLPQVFETEFTFPDGTRDGSNCGCSLLPKGSACTRRTSTSGSGGEPASPQDRAPRSGAPVAVYTWPRTDAVRRQLTRRGVTMEIDRRAFITTLGGTTAVGLMSDEAKADALEEFMSARLNETVAMQQAPGRPDVSVSGGASGTDRDAADAARRRESVRRSHGQRQAARSDAARSRGSWTSSRCGSTGRRITACRARPRRCGRG